MNRIMFRKMLLVGAIAVALMTVTCHGPGRLASLGWLLRLWRAALGWNGYNYGYYAGWGAGWSGLGWGGPGCCDYGVYRPAYVPPVTACYTGCFDPCCTPAYRGCFSRLSYRWNAHHYGYYWGYRRPLWSVATCCPTCGEISTDCGCGSVEGDMLYGQPSVVPEANPQSPTLAVPPAGGQDLPTPEKQTSLTVDSALLTVSVPTDARVLVNGMPTRSTGELRRYVSKNLNPGFNYTYEVTAEANVNGTPVTQTKTVHLRAGDQVELAFDLRTQEPVETALTLHVPSDAKVFLAGNETRGRARSARSARRNSTAERPGASTWSK